MSLQCKKCSGRNTEVVKAKDMAEKTGDNNFITATSGFANPVLIIGAIKAIAELLGKIFGWLTEKKKGERNVVVCKDCGYWERV